MSSQPEAYRPFARVVIEVHVLPGGGVGTAAAFSVASEGPVILDEDEVFAIVATAHEALKKQRAASSA